MGSPHPVEVWCDHKNLSYFRSTHQLSPQQSRWSLFLSQFDIQITHKPGKHMLGSDLLSRRSDHGEEPPEEAILLPPHMFIGAINLDLISRILSALPTDSFAKYIRNALSNPAPSPHRHSLEDWSEQDGLLMFRGRTYVPDELELRQEIVRSFHDLPSAGHPG